MTRRVCADKAGTESRFDRLLVISPMIDPRALKVAETLGSETYGDSTEVEGL